VSNQSPSPQPPAHPQWSQPPYGQYPPPTAYAAQPRKVVSTRKMGFVGHGIHIFMCMITMGLWIPVYLSRLRSRKTVTRTY
jgi:hypothetical protein